MTSELVSIEIPTDGRELNVVLLELDSPWHSVNQIEAVLASLERIDLGLVRMSVDLENWSDYDRRVAAKAVWKGVRKETSITLSSADERFWASVSRHDRTPEIGTPVHRNIVTFTLPACEVRVWGLEKVQRSIEVIAESLSSFTVATASACGPVRFPALMDCPQPIRPLSQSAWLHVVSKRGWSSLGLPHRVSGELLRSERRSDGSVWIWSYADPFRYDTEESVAGMRAFSHWMNDVE